MQIFKDIAKQLKKYPLWMNLVNLTEGDEAELNKFLQETKEAFQEIGMPIGDIELAIMSNPVQKMMFWDLQRQIKEMTKEWATNSGVNHNDVEKLNWLTKTIWVFRQNPILKDGKLDSETTIELTPDNEKNYYEIFIAIPVLQMMTGVDEKARVKKCAADGCKKYFVAASQGIEQKYHSKKCYWRENKRQYRDRKKTMSVNFSLDI